MSEARCRRTKSVRVSHALCTGILAVGYVAVRGEHDGADTGGVGRVTEVRFGCIFAPVMVALVTGGVHLWWLRDVGSCMWWTWRCAQEELGKSTYSPSYNTSHIFSSSFNVSWSSFGSCFLGGGIEKSGRVPCRSTGTPSTSWIFLLLSLAMVWKWLDILATQYYTIERKRSRKERRKEEKLESSPRHALLVVPHKLASA